MSRIYRTDIARIERFDVVVIGSGCAGFSAAVCAARSGAKTVLLEKHQMIGGTATSSLVGPFMTSFDGQGERQIVRGIFDELVTRLEKRGGAVHPSKTGDNSPYSSYHKGYDHRHFGVTPFCSALLQIEMIQMLKEAGVKVLINTAVIDVVKDKDTVTAIVAHDGSDLRLFETQVAIDCSGDAIAAYKAGAVRPECSNENTDLQPMSLIFSLYGVEDNTIQRYIDSHPDEHGALFRCYVQEACNNGEFPIERDLVGLFKCLKSGEWRMNTTRMQNLSPVVAEDLTAAYEIGMKQIFFLLDFCRQLPGMENMRLKEIASSIGIRESRRIDGVYTLQPDDLMKPVTFYDSIGMGSFPLDRHPSSGAAGGLATNPKPANCFQIPYRILVPRLVDGLLAAGRCVSASRDAQASIRVMPQAFIMGQAAGTAAGICIKSGIKPREVPYELLKLLLLEQKAVLE